MNRILVIFDCGIGGSELKDIELKLISELIKNSRRSDRELARVLGISQPTVSRTRVRLEKQGLIDYSAVPNLAKLDFQIMAVILGKRDYSKQPENYPQKIRDFVKRHPNIIFVARGSGLGYDRTMISIHRSYADYSKFMQETRNEWTGIVDVNCFLISLTDKDVVQPLSLKHFAEHLKKEEELK
jgi:DNA-binding Lrp family transcriptional regulator